MKINDETREDKIHNVVNLNGCDDVFRGVLNFCGRAPVKSVFIPVTGVNGLEGVTIGIVDLQTLIYYPWRPTRDNNMPGDAICVNSYEEFRCAEVVLGQQYQIPEEYVSSYQEADEDEHNPFGEDINSDDEDEKPTKRSQPINPGKNRPPFKKK